MTGQSGLSETRLAEKWPKILQKMINPFFTKPENEKLWNIPDHVFNVQ
jgi:exonuclease V gamma subunit